MFIELAFKMMTQVLSKKKHHFHHKMLLFSGLSDLVLFLQKHL